MFKLSIAACVLFTASLLHAQTLWQPSQGHTQIPIWPGVVPDARAMKGPENMKSTGTSSLVAGKPWLSVERVATPTMTVYSPTGKNTGAAVIVFPGGGYEILAIDLEGTEVCDWLTAGGVTCVLLKYRVPAPRSAPDWGAYPQSPIASGRRAEDDRSCPLSCRGVAHRSTQDRRDGILCRRSSGDGGKRALR